MNSQFQCDVLIAGLGPVGATLAALLGRRGISVLAIEPEQTVYPLPRAAHIDHETMRILQSIGVMAAIRPHVREAPDYEFRTKAGERLMRIERQGVVGASGWPVSYNIHQPGLETAIRALLDCLPSVRLRFGARFTGLIPSGADGIVATVEIDGAPARCSARFLVGCDGAASAVREACGIGLHDYAFDEPWLVLDALVADESGFPAMNLQICDPARPTSFVHMGPGRLRWEFMLKPGEAAEAMKQDAAVASLLAPWRTCGNIVVERRAVYRFHGLVARQWRHGRTFLAGDAAHQMPPFMGQGLCSGLRDVVNLAWKLEAALAGHAANPLLDSYQAERAAQVRHVIERAIEMGRIVCTLDPVRAAARDAAMLRAPASGPPLPFPPLADGCILPGSPGAGALFPQPVDAASGTYLDDYLGAGAWLLHRPTLARPLATGAVTAIDLTTLAADFARPIADWLDRRGVEAVLVRPDRTVFGSGQPGALLEAYQQWVSPRALRQPRHPPAPIYDADIYSDAAILEPYAHYRALRDLGPVVRLPRHHLWAMARYQDVAAALRNHALFSSASGVAVSDITNAVASGTTISSDPPVHDALRRIIAAPLTPAAVNLLRPRLSAAADALVTALVARRTFDAAIDLARHLPLSIVSHMVGLPDDGRENMLSWAAATFDIFGPENDRTRAARPVVREMRHYVASLAARDRVRAASWADRLLDHVDRGAIPLEQFATLLRDYLGPSLDTTIFATSSLIWLFSQHPEQWDLVRADPSLIRNAINEAVRLESPIRGFTRTLTEDADVGATMLPKGARVLLLYASANRDERKWQAPERFDVRRRVVDQLGFGLGVHSCAGMHLARLEIECLIAALVPRVARFHAQPPVRAVNNTLRGLASLPVRIE